MPSRLLSKYRAAPAALCPFGLCLIFALACCAPAVAGSIDYSISTSSGDPNYPVSGSLTSSSGVATALVFTIDGTPVNYFDEQQVLGTNPTFNNQPFHGLSLVGGGPPCIGGGTGNAAIGALFADCTGAMVAQSGTFNSTAFPNTSAVEVSFSTGADCGLGVCSSSATLNVVCFTSGSAGLCAQIPQADAGLIIARYSSIGNSSGGPSGPAGASTPEPASGIYAAAALLVFALVKPKGAARRIRENARCFVSAPDRD